MTGGKIVLLNEVTIEHNHGGSSRINLNTASITKTEVQISRHVYVSRNLKGAERVFTTDIPVVNNLVSGAIYGNCRHRIISSYRRVFIRTIIYVRLSWLLYRIAFQGIVDKPASGKTSEYKLLKCS